MEALRSHGFESVRQTVSHPVMRKEGRSVVVPMHKPLKPGTLRGLLDQAALSLEEFVGAL